MQLCKMKNRKNTNLTTMRHRPLKPRMIWRVEATINAPCVPRMIRRNFCKQFVHQLLFILWMNPPGILGLKMDGP